MKPIFTVPTFSVAALMMTLASAPAGMIDWTTWANNTQGTITMPQGPVGVTYSGQLYGLAANYPSWTPTPTFADGSVVANAPAPSGGMIRLTGGNSALQTVSFSEPVHNPVVAIWSLGQPGLEASFVFDQTPTFISGGPSAEFGGTPITVSGNTVSGLEGNGTVMFLGDYSSLSWTNPQFENYYGFTVGATAVPEPGTLAMGSVVGAGVLGFVAKRRAAKR